MDQQQATANQITVFYSYAPADERLQKQLETHLGLLRQQGIIAEWHDRQIVPGTDWAHELDVHRPSLMKPPRAVHPSHPFHLPRHRKVTAHKPHRLHLLK